VGAAWLITGEQLAPVAIPDTLQSALPAYRNDERKT